MAIGLVELVFALVNTAVSIGAGWWLRGRSVPAPTPAQPAEAEEKVVQDKERAKETLVQLHQLASNVAADVGAHNSRVREINNELAGEADPDAVVAAVSKLIDANERMQQQLELAESRLHDQARRMEDFETEARTDALTKIANRRAFDRRRRAA